MFTNTDSGWFWASNIPAVGNQDFHHLHTTWHSIYIFIRQPAPLTYLTFGDWASAPPSTCIDEASFFINSYRRTKITSSPTRLFVICLPARDWASSTYFTATDLTSSPTCLLVSCLPAWGQRPLNHSNCQGTNLLTHLSYCHPFSLLEFDHCQESNLQTSCLLVSLLEIKPPQLISERWI